MEDRSRPRSPAEARLPHAAARLPDQIRSGDAAVGQQFVREHYGAIYRYLLYLAGQPDLAEDLTQETFLQAWRRRETFQGRGSLRGWLLRIAHREFLHLLQRRQAQSGSEELAELPAPDGTAWLDTLALRAVIDRLPLEQREAVLLHYLEGYSSAEIARIVDAPAATVRYRLARAREQLRQALGEDDLTYLNEPAAPMRQWAWLPLDQMHALEARLTHGAEAKEITMQRREFLRHAAAGTAGLMLTESEKEVVDGRLTQKVTLAIKATAFTDLCTHLATETGIQIAAGASVADEKVTIFCEKLPLREVMRQLSRPFGYVWLRSRVAARGAEARDRSSRRCADQIEAGAGGEAAGAGAAGEYKYELVQDLRSQLLEEELRNRDRNAALLAFEREIERYRSFLSLSPDEALARSRSAPPEEKALMERFAGRAWGAIQMFFRLTPQQMASIRAGKELPFRTSPGPNEQRLPPDVARGVLESQRDWRMHKVNPRYDLAQDETGRALTGPDTVALAAVPELRGKVGLNLLQMELGQFALYGEIGWQAIGPNGKSVNESSMNAYVFGTNAAVREPDNATATARFARDPALRSTVTVRPQPSYRPTPDPDAPEQPVREPKVTTADVLEALHRASGLALVADHYTRLYPVAAVSTGSQPLYEAVNQLAAAMRLRWNLSDGNWLQFRSASYYNDRLKEVPNRLLARWAGARKRQGMLALDDLAEIAQLPDAQLDGEEMAEGAREYFGLREWELARSGNTREGLRFVASLTPGQRQEARSPGGLPFARMSLAQQQRFLAIALSTDRAGVSAEALAEPLHSLDELAGAALRVEYIQPGGFQWLHRASRGSAYPMVVPLEPGPRGRRALVPPARGRTRAATLEVARGIDVRLREGLTRIDTAHLDDPGLPVEPASPQETEIVPTRLDLWFVYFLGTSSPRPSLTRNQHLNCYQGARGRQ